MATDPITRRTALRASLSAVPLLAAPGLAQTANALRRASEADAKLIALGKEHDEARVELDRTCDMLEVAEMRYRRECEHYRFPAIPADRQDSRWVGFVDSDGVRRMGLDEIRRHVACRPGQFIGHSEITDWARTALPAAEANQSALDNLYALCGVEAAEDAQQQAYDRLRDIEPRIQEAPARSIAGLVVKAKVIEAMHGCDVTKAGRALARAVLAIAGETEALS